MFTMILCTALGCGGGGGGGGQPDCGEVECSIEVGRAKAGQCEVAENFVQGVCEANNGEGCYTAGNQTCCPTSSYTRGGCREGLCCIESVRGRCDTVEVCTPNGQVIVAPM